MGPPASTGRNGPSETGERAKTPSDDGGGEAGVFGAPTEHPPDDPALVVEGISKQFGSGADSVLAVDDVGFTVDQGSVVGLLGPNGAGKTTLVKCILGIIVPDAGAVELFGTDATDGRRSAYLDIDAVLEGARNDYWRLTVRENLRYFATISGIDPDSVATRHNRLLERLDLAEHADTPVRNLSRGMKQKVSLASVLAGGAKLLFLDEPTLGLDVESSRTLRTELKRLARQEGLTIVISSHDMRVIDDVCDRVLIMSDGRTVADSSVEELLGAADRNAVRITSTDLDDRLLARLGETFELLETNDVEGGRRAEIALGGEAFYDLMESLREADVTIDRLHTVEPDLEDVFVELTGDQRGLTPPTEEK